MGYDKFQGNYTTKEKSVVDYIIATPGLLSRAVTFDIDIFDPLFSDFHKFICTSFNIVPNSSLWFSKTQLKTNSVTNNPIYLQDKDTTETQNVRDKERYRVKWSPEQIEQLSDQEASNLLELNDLSNALNVDELLFVYERKMLQFYDACCMLKPVWTNQKNSMKKGTMKRKQGKPWFNDNCKKMLVKYITKQKSYVILRP